MLEQIILILIKALIAPLILEIIKNQPDRGGKFLLGSLRILIATVIGTFLAGFISVFVDIIFNTEEINLNSPLGIILVTVSATLIWLIVNQLTRD